MENGHTSNKRVFVKTKCSGQAQEVDFVLFARLKSESS